MSGVLSFGQARPLCALENPADAEALAVRITRENLTVRQIEEVIATGSFARSSHSQRKRGPSRPRTRRFLELEECLELALETRVRVEGSSKGGWVKVMFADEEDLARLRSLMARGTGE